MPRTTISARGIVLCLALAVAAPAFAQAPAAPSNQSDLTQHQQMMSGMMKNMSQQMNGMAERMGRGDLTPDQAKQMGQQMQRMSTMMHRMSGMAAKPSMGDRDFQHQMDQMRQQMNGMMGTPPANPGTK